MKIKPEITTSGIIDELSMITTTIAPNIDDLEEALFVTTLKPTILEDSLFETTISTTSTEKSVEVTSEISPKINATTTKEMSGKVS